MSDEATTQPKPAAKKGNPAVTWTIRIVVFGVLAGLLAVAILQFRVKKQFENSQAAIQEAEDDSTGPITLDQFEEALDGSPEAADAKASGFYKAKVYTWNGIFQDYRLKVRYAGNSKYISDWTAKQEDIEE